MTQDDHAIIRVGEDRVGLRGLKSAMEELAQSPEDKTDEELAQALLEKLSKNNYIAYCARDEYAQALVREFRKFLGQTVEDPVPKGLSILVLGPGCAQCNRLEQVVKQVLTEMGLAAAVDHVTDIKEIGTYGVVSTPALVINGKIMSKGTVPPARKIKEWLAAANG
jgi:small redox-active disulfide protein 2